MAIHAIIKEILKIVDEAYSAGYYAAANDYGAAPLNALNVEGLRRRTDRIRSGVKLVQESVLAQLTRTS